jgi:MSHA biogenesis protein MshQ
VGLTSYGIGSFQIGEKAVVNLPGGDYYIDDLTMSAGSIINATGTGTVRLYLNKKLTLGSGARINFTAQPSKVFIYAYGDVQMSSDSSIDGYIYAASTVTLHKGAIITGAVSGKEIDLEEDSHIDYKSTDIANTDFGGVCSTTPPGPATVLGEYRFDQCSLADSIIDTQGNYNATEHGLSESDGDGAIGRSLDLS